MLCFVNTWELEQAQRVGAEVKRLRGKRSAAWLSEMTEVIGLKMTRQTITDLENGRRRYVTTSELTVLAAALNTSPINLLYPGPYDREIEFLPGVQYAEFNAAQWFCGVSWRQFADAELDHRVDERSVEKVNALRDEWFQNITPLKLWRRLFELEGSLSGLLSLGDFELYREQIEAYRKLIADLREQLGLSASDD